jgi:hypothetical protein
MHSTVEQLGAAVQLAFIKRLEHLGQLCFDLLPPPFGELRQVLHKVSDAGCFGRTPFLCFHSPAEVKRLKSTRSRVAVRPSANPSYSFISS